MIKKFKLEDLDCANCAAKIENSVKKLDKVIDVKVNFLTQKMILEADEQNIDTLIPEIKKVISRVEPDCTLKLL